MAIYNEKTSKTTRANAKNVRDKNKRIKEKEDKKKSNKENRVYIKRFISSLMVIIVFATFIYFYSLLVGAKGFNVKEYIIYKENIPLSFDGFKIVHLSDIHYNVSINNLELNKVVTNINDLNADIIVMSGDLLDNHVYSELEQKELSMFLSNLTAKVGKYIISGNHDYTHDYWDLIIKDSDFVNLDNAFDSIFYKDNIPIYIGGVSTNLFGDKKTADKIKIYNEFLVVNKDAFSILLMHEPDYVDNIDINNFDLVLSGHSHNGQINIPFLKKLVLPIGSKKYYNSYYGVKDSQLYISSGLGTTGLPIRLFNKPSVNLYRLSTKKNS